MIFISTVSQKKVCPTCCEVTWIDCIRGFKNNFKRNWAVVLTKIKQCDVRKTWVLFLQSVECFYS